MTLMPDCSYLDVWWRAHGSQENMNEIHSRILVTCVLVGGITVYTWGNSKQMLSLSN